ncbi:MAG: hypothetical protein SGJ05_07635 [bacterium]|nr:hypothetical protein [bacterium]
MRNSRLLFVAAITLCAFCGTPTAFSQDLRVINGCPPEGSAEPGTRKAELFKLKSVYKIPSASEINRHAIDEFLERGDDTERWNEGAAVEMDVFIGDVYAAETEDCNCRLPGDEMRDTRVLMYTQSTNKQKRLSMVGEVTPRIKALKKSKGLDWSTTALKQFKGKWMRVRGWLLFDWMHVGNAVNTKPRGRALWRATAWELHPLTDIKPIP